MKTVKIIVPSLILVWPAVSSAAILAKTGGLFQEALGIIYQFVIPLAFALAMLFFFWGIAKYIRSTGTDKEEGRKIMIWGVVALFVMSSVWGLVAFLQDEFDIPDASNPMVPGFNIKP